MTTVEISTPHIEIIELPDEFVDEDCYEPLTREQHIERLEQIRDGNGAEDAAVSALHVGQAAMYLLGERFSSLEHPISPQVMDANRRPIVHDPTRPAHVELYKFRQPDLPLLSLITGRRYQGRFVGPETVTVLPRELHVVENLALHPHMLFATDQGYGQRVFVGDAPSLGRKSYADFVAYAAGVMYEVLTTPE